MSDTQAIERRQLRVRKGTVAGSADRFTVYLITFCGLHWQKRL